jgi:hypothetical protein
MEYKEQMTGVCLMFYKSGYTTSDTFTVVNLSLVTHINTNSETHIIFEFDKGNTVVWKYDSVKDRDDELYEISNVLSKNYHTEFAL